MVLDVVNGRNEKVASVEVSDALFGGRVKADVIWASVVRENASERRGTHKTKNRANVQGSGRKLWKQKGTGRARVSDVRNPLWRKGGTVFGPQPRSYGYQLPRKVERAALREALTAKLRDGALTVVETIALDTPGTKAAAELIARLGAKGRILVIDVAPDAAAVRSFRNLARTELRATGHVSARDVVGAGQVIVTRAAIERLQTVLGGDAGDADAASPAETQESGS